MVKDVRLYQGMASAMPQEARLAEKGADEAQPRGSAVAPQRRVHTPPGGTVGTLQQAAEKVFAHDKAGLRR